MDVIHKTSLHAWISEVIDLKSLLAVTEDPVLKNCEKYSFEEYMKTIFPDFNSKKFEDDSNAALDDYNPLEEKITMGKQLNIPEDVKLNLKTIDYQKIHVDSRNSDPAYEIFHYNSSKNIDFPIGKPIIPTLDESDLTNKINLPEIILTIQVYHPTRRRQMDMSGAKVQVDQEFYVYGQQYLTELKDVIICFTDEAAITKITPEMALQYTIDDCTKAKECYTGGSFFFGTTLYDDRRNSMAEEYAPLFEKWIRDQAKDIEQVDVSKMEDTKFIDLKNIRLGYPYVYIHQGYCEHLIVITDARLMTRDDCLYQRCYPLRSRVIPKRGIMCMFCRKIVAKWMVKGNPDLPENPSLFCQLCFEKFHCDDKDGSILDKYQNEEVFPFPDRSQII